MDKLRIGLFCVLALAVAGGLAGCGDDDDSGSNNTDGGTSGSSGSSGKAGSSGSSGKAGSSGSSGKAGSSGSSSGDAGTDSGMTMDRCPDIGNRDTVEVSGEITKDTTWTCDNLYILTNDLVFVTGDSQLTVEAGTVIQGDPGTGLIVTQGSTLVTHGTKDEPVVFTSSSEEGSRLAGDWGGVVMLGNAPINFGDTNHIEGVDPTDERGTFGGTDDTWNCGSLKYTRIEFAGYEYSIDNELNGLTLGACGSDTTISYVEVHRGSDDCIEMFGGGATFDHIVMSQCKDDGFDSDEGNQAHAQFMVIQQNPDECDKGFEWDNLDGDHDASPRSHPIVYNTTLIGTNDPNGAQTGMHLRRGTAGNIYNVIVMGFPVTGIDVDSTESAAQCMMDPPQLTVENSLFFENGPDGMTHFSPDATDNDGGFNEDAFFRDDARHNVFDMDPKLNDPYNLSNPDFVPAASSPAKDGAKTPPTGFDKTATYMGAFKPGGPDWTEGWTSFAQD